MWNAAGFAIALALCALASWRSRARGGFYDAEVYGMTPATHRSYAAISLAFAVFFAVAWWRNLGSAGLYALAVYAVIVIFYGTSFLRGAYEDEGDRRP